MNRTEFDELVRSYMTNMLDQLFPHGVEVLRVKRINAELLMERFAKLVEREARGYYLTNLYSVDDLAKKFGISGQRMRAIAQNRHERYGIGMKINGGWVWSIDEIEYLRPDERYRKKSE